MRPIFFFSLSVFVLCSCTDQTIVKTAAKKYNDTIETANGDRKNYDNIINPTLQYDQSFIDGLSHYGESLKLIANFIVAGQDTTYFPEELPLNKEVTFKGMKIGRTYRLTVARKNRTSLNYQFRMVDKEGKVTHNRSGTAIISSTFFLGSETDEDDKTGNGYLSVEYWDNSTDCSFAIRVGEKDSFGKLRAKINLFCHSDKSKNIELDEAPTLRTE
jgi:hypothetical protein